MTIQYIILTKMKSGIDDNGNIVINIFYRQNKKVIEENFALAKEMYAQVFRKFIYTWGMLGKDEAIVKENLEKLII